MSSESSAPSDPTGSAPWAQPGITALSDAGAFLDTLRSRASLVFYSADGDVGYPRASPIHHLRGQGASVSASIVAATPPPPELVAYHRALGLGPERLYCPARLRAGAPLAKLVLDDPALVDRIRRDPQLRQIVLAFKDNSAERLLGALGLAPAYCAPQAFAYEAANDKFEFARAGAHYGFPTLPMEQVDDPAALEPAFRSLAEIYGAGCVLRLRRGAGGEHVYHARSLPAARHAWRRLRARGALLVVARVPAELVLREVAAHGIATKTGFRPLVFSEQILQGYRFRGSRVTREWSEKEIRAISSALEGITRWLQDIGYVDAPVGVDGFLMGGPEGTRFVAIDPNVRMTGTMGPWAVMAALSEMAGKGFIWQTEHFAMLGPAITFPWLRTRLGADLLDAARLEQGGILPSLISPPWVGPFGISRLRVILLAHDAHHLTYLRRRVRLGLLVR